MPRVAQDRAAGQGIKLQTLCRSLGVSYRDARYALARGIVPPGADSEPGRGNHRVFSPDQAFFLALVLKVKAAGIHTPLAGLIAEWSRRVHGLSVNLGWDRQFVPFRGKLKTEHAWYVDVGDAHYVRLVTDANPSRQGLDALPWVDVKTRKNCPTANPSVIVRVNLSQIAGLLDRCRQAE